MSAVLFSMLRLLGKRELSKLTPFELVVLIVMGDLIQQGVTHNYFSPTVAIIAICTFPFWETILSWFTYLSPRAERLLEGQPCVIIRSGQFLNGNLSRDRMTRGEVETEMQIAGISNLDDVAWGILERNGRISFIKRQA